MEIGNWKFGNQEPGTRNLELFHPTNDQRKILILPVSPLFSQISLMTMVNRRALVPLYVLGIMFYVLIINDVKVVAQDGAIRNEILMEVNKLRKEGCTCGEEKMPPVMEVTWNDKLEKAAAKHADDLFKNSRFSHMGNDGSEASDRVEKAGYKWSAVGENIGKGYATAAQVVNGWRQSPGHCRNMMDPSFREIGAARKGEIWVLNLGAWRE